MWKLVLPLLLFLLTMCAQPVAAASVGRQAGNWAVFGASGSGKSTFVRELVREYQRRVPFGVIFAPTEELSELAGKKEYVSPARQMLNYDAATLQGLHRRFGWIHYEVAPSQHTKQFVHQALEPMWKLGKFETDKCQFVIVYLEGKNYVAKHRMAANSERAESEGRKFGIDIIKDFQRWASQGADAPDYAALSQVTRRVVLPTEELNARKRLLQEIPEARDPGVMLRPDRVNGWGGEMDIIDSLSGTKAQVLRRGDGSRVVKLL